MVERMSERNSEGTLAERIFAGRGEMATLIRTKLWSDTPLGPVETWPGSLRTAVSICLGSRHPIVLWWGPERWMFYNDAYRPMLGESKHPQFLGASGQACWAEIWDVIGPMMEQVIETGEATWSEDLLLLMRRHGYLEETYFTFSYSPIRDEDGKPYGIFNACAESTARVLGERRMKLLRELTVSVGTEDEAARRSAEVLEQAGRDIPFALLYLRDGDDGAVRLAASAGVDSTAHSSLTKVERTGADGRGWPVGGALTGGKPVVVEDLAARFDAIPTGPWDEPARRAMLLPVGRSGAGAAAGVLILAISPRRAFDDAYRRFFDLVATQVSTALSAAKAYDLERERAERFAEVDRAKTGFFNNVSHEFGEGPASAGPNRDQGRAAAYVSEASRWRGAAASDRRRPAEPPVPAGPRILLAEDNADMREYIVRLLAPRWKIDAVEDGQAALEALRAAPPDLVLSDVMMPRLDGIGLLRAIRGDPKTATIPFLLLSARAGEEAVVSGLDTGADDYLVKPFSAPELLSRVGTHLELARARRAWATEIERVNQELEAFSYSVSHDLRAPLRAIDGFSKALSNEQAGLGEKGRHYLERIRAGTQRMSDLIDDLLKLSRIARTPVRRERVDLSTLANEVAEELRRREPHRAVTIDVATGLSADGDRQLVRIVLDNLLGNAWKFTSKRPEGRIQFGVETIASGRAFFVRDNGAGFDMSYADKLFAPFQRLHKASEFDGTGIGLATVQRIITRHAGHLSAVGEADVGATFFFTLGENP
jgi:signal transduction histidine kinase/GAF domain-containing protein